MVQRYWVSAYVGSAQGQRDMEADKLRARQQTTCTLLGVVGLVGLHIGKTSLQQNLLCICEEPPPRAVLEVEENDKRNPTTAAHLQLGFVPQLEESGDSKK